jgi:hypothetical protein
MVHDTCSICLLTTRKALWGAKEPSEHWVCNHCTAMTEGKREEERSKNAKRRRCRTCSRPFQEEKVPSCTLFLEGWWYCGPECHPHANDDEYASYTRPGSAGSLRYYLAYSGYRDHLTEAELDSLGGALVGVDSEYDYYDPAD